MFKRLLLATLTVIIGMWAAGYDLVAFSHKYVNAAQDQADRMTGRATIEKDDWGPAAN